MKNTIVLILSLLVIGLGSYVIFDKVINKDSNGITVTEENFNLDSARALVNKYTLKESGNFLFWEEMFSASQMTDKQKVYITIQYTNTTSGIFSCEEAFPNGKYDAIGYSVMEEEKGFCQDGDTFYDYDILNKTYKELFGKDAVMPKTEVTIFLDKYKYSDTYNAYISLYLPSGGVPWQQSYYDVVDAKLKGDMLEIYVKYAQYETDYDTQTMYLTTNKSLKIVGEPHDVTEEQLKDIYEKGMDTLPTYKFIFKKTDLGYYFASLNLES